MTEHPSARWRSVGELLSTTAQRTPDAPAIAFPGGAMSYAELAGASRRAARRLHGAGVRPGDRVGILLREASPDYVAHGLGAMHLGAICVPVNARNKVRELEYVVAHAGMRILLTDGEFAGLVAEAELPDDCRTVALDGDEALAAAAPEETVVALERAVGAADPALMLYTSGTTANPKGCVHTHATLLAEGENCASRLGMTGADRFWTALQMFHVGGWQVLLSALSRGACASHPGAFEAGAALDQLERERCTIAFPAFELIWMGVLDHPRFPAADLSALRIVMNVGVPERMLRMQERVPQAKQVSCFGSTESCGSMCLGDPADSLHSRTHTSGRPLPGIEVRAVDPATGTAVPAGTPGELHFRGATRFAGYYGDPKATAAAIDDERWFRTGDLVRLEPDGGLVFVSRLKEMLKVGGENVSAADIEGYLLTHPDVAMVSVVPAPDARYGEVPAAFVQCHDDARVTADELVDFCLGRIATFKVPRYVRFVDAFPVTATQKIRKHVLRERIETELREAGIREAPKLVAPR